MGNYTWCYVEYSPSEKTLEEIKRDCLKTVDYYSNLSKEELEEIEPDDFREHVKFLREYIRLNKLPEKFDYSVAKVLCDLVGYGNIAWINGKWYKPIPLREPFRIKEAGVTDYFTDPEKLIEWLKKRNDVSHYSTKNSKVFWGVSQDLEDEIRTIFKEHPGLLIMF